MPKPNAGESHTDWMHRCMHRQKEEGKEHTQSVAICLNMWRERDKGEDRARERKGSDETLDALYELEKKITELMEGLPDDGSLSDIYVALSALAYKVDQKIRDYAEPGKSDGQRFERKGLVGLIYDLLIADGSATALGFAAAIAAGALVGVGAAVLAVKIRDYLRERQDQISAAQEQLTEIANNPPTDAAGDWPGNSESSSDRRSIESKGAHRLYR